jgi:opacity protein-like surface antigen
MPRHLILIAAILLAMPVSATEFTATLGLQVNRDMELADDVAPIVGEPGESVSVDDAGALGLAMDWIYRGDITKRYGVFLTHSQTDIGDKAGLADSGLAVSHLHFTGTSYYPNGNWEPFVTAGIGAAFFSPKDSTLDSTTRLSFNIGGGANYKFSEQLLLRLEARWIPTLFNGSAAGICSGGCTIAFKSDMYSQFQANVGLQFRF